MKVRLPWRCSPVLLPNRPLQRRFGPLRASEGLDSSLLEAHQPLQVVAGGHHRHRKVRSRLADRTDQLATHLIDGYKHVLDPGARLGDAMVAALLTLGQPFVALALPLDLIAIAMLLEPALPIRTGVAPVCIDITTGVRLVDDRVEVLAVVGAGRARFDVADDLVLLVDVDRELVFEVVPAVLLRPSGIGVLLPSLGGLPVSGHQCRIDDLTTTGDESMREQLSRDTVEQDLFAGFADAVLERPHRRSIRNIDRAGQPADSLVGHLVKQLVLHLLILQILQPLQHQNTHHRLGWIRRTTALQAHRPRCYPIDFGRQRCEVDTRLDLGKRIPERLDPLAMMVVGKEVRLDGNALLHGWTQRHSQDIVILPSTAESRLFEVPLCLIRVTRMRWFCLRAQRNELWRHDQKGHEMHKELSFEKNLAGHKVFITGHTGFTGGWVSLWLHAVGAEIAGYSLAPDTTPSLFEALKLAAAYESTIGDICDYEKLYAAIDSFQPDLILHLAAQPLVRKSYREPVRTFMVNAQGTAHVLEAARNVKSIKGVLCITTDKVYKNNEWPWPYRENDPLGGKDPYSASKAAAEMVIQSYATSYPWADAQGPAIATARGGNIIGGGDWSEDRLIPDFVRAVVNGGALKLRYPDATRPWQHVLALVHGYLLILAELISRNPAKAAKAWNLGPHDAKQYSVRDVLELMGRYWTRPTLDYMNLPLPEAQALALDSSLARNELNWGPVWDTERVIQETANWYREYYSDPVCARDITLAQINAWREAIPCRST